MDKAKIITMLIKNKGISRRAFAEEIKFPPTTLQSMLTRGIDKASVVNVLNICKALGITLEELDRMSKSESLEVIRKPEPQNTMSSYFDGEKYTEKEMEEIIQYAKFIKAKRK